MPIPDFIVNNAGWRNLPLQLHFATIILGAFSFLIPMVWTVSVRISSRTARGETAAGLAPRAESGKSRSNPGKKKRSKASPTIAASLDQPETSWRLSPFRLLLYMSFCALSMQATRNSHQFAAVVGAVTAWNFGEWAAAVRRHRATWNLTLPKSSSVRPRLIALAAIVLVIIWVGSGQFYSMAGEGRVIELGEQRLWFPHEAVQFAGKPGMPGRFLSFHNGHASLYEYYYGPQKKVYTDPRLEVAGADLFQRYRDLEERISRISPAGKPNWTRSTAPSSWSITSSIRARVPRCWRVPALALCLVRRHRRSLHPRFVTGRE